MEPETPNVKLVSGYVLVSDQLLDDQAPDYDRYIMGTLAHAYGLAIDAETAALLDRVNWRPPWLDDDPWDDD